MINGIKSLDWEYDLQWQYFKNLQFSPQHTKWISLKDYGTSMLVLKPKSFSAKPESTVWVVDNFLSYPEDLVQRLLQLSRSVLLVRIPSNICEYEHNIHQTETLETQELTKPHLKKSLFRLIFKLICLDLVKGRAVVYYMTFVVKIIILESIHLLKSSFPFSLLNWLSSLFQFSLLWMESRWLALDHNLYHPTMKYTLLFWSGGLFTKRTLDYMYFVM